MHCLVSQSCYCRFSGLRERPSLGRSESSVRLLQSWVFGEAYRSTKWQRGSRYKEPDSMPIENYQSLIKIKMQIKKFEPLGEVDSIFEQFISFPKLGLDLAADVYEKDGKVIVKMNLPSIRPEELDISLEHNVLTISGKRDEEEEVEKKDYYSKEIRRGLFSRTLRLPKAVDSERSEAKYENGELIVAMPTVIRSKEKVVKVRVKK